MKRLFSFIIFSLFLTALQAHTILMIGDIIKIDGKEVIKYEKNLYGSFSLYNMDGDELIMYKLHDNETPTNGQDDYYTLSFLTEKKKVESFPAAKTTGMFGLNAKKTAGKIVEWLLREKVLLPDGTLDPDRIEVFVQKYDENIQNRTIRF